LNATPAQLLSDAAPVSPPGAGRTAPASRGAAASPEAADGQLFGAALEQALETRQGASESRPTAGSPPERSERTSDGVPERASSGDESRDAGPSTRAPEGKRGDKDTDRPAEIRPADNGPEAAASGEADESHEEEAAGIRRLTGRVRVEAPADQPVAAAERRTTGEHSGSQTPEPVADDATEARATARIADGASDGERDGRSHDAAPAASEQAARPRAAFVPEAAQALRAQEPARGDAPSRVPDLHLAAARDSGVPAQLPRKGEADPSDTRPPRRGRTSPAVVGDPAGAQTRSADQTSSMRQSADAPVPEARPERREDAGEADAPSGDRETGKWSPSELTDGVRAPAETRVAWRVPSGARTTRSTTASAVQDAQPQAGLAAWRSYATEPGQATTATAKGAAQQAFHTAQREVVQQARLVGRNGRSEVTVRLHPPELGRMKVQILMRAGKLDVKIGVEDPQVREAMKEELQNLDRALRTAQLEPTRLEVSDYQTGRQGGWEGPAQGRTDSAPSGGAVGVPEAQDHVRPAEWSVFSEAGGIDCLV